MHLDGGSHSSIGAQKVPLTPSILVTAKLKREVFRVLEFNPIGLPILSFFFLLCLNAAFKVITKVIFPFV